MKTINIGKDFSDHPIGRYRTDGEASGEAFRDDVLVPALRSLNSNEKIKIILDDGVEGYGSSFLVEAFAGVVRNNITSGIDLKSKLIFYYNDQDFAFFEEKIKQYIDEA